MNIIPIVMCFDENVFIDACVAIKSIIETSNCNNLYEFNLYFKDKSETHDHILQDIVSEKNNARIIYRDVDKIVKKYNLSTIPTNYHVNYLACVRLFVPFDLKHVYDKVVYTDTDVVFKEDIANVFLIDIKDKSVGAVKEFYYNLINNRIIKTDVSDQLLDFWEKNNLKMNYFSGLQILNLKKITKSIKASQILTILKQQSIFYDQCTFNILFRDDIFDLSYVWASDIRFCEDYVSFLNHPAIKPLCSIDFIKSLYYPSVIHYLTAEKPLFSNRYRRCEKDWWEVAAHLKFFNIILNIKKRYMPDFSPIVYGVAEGRSIYGYSYPYGKDHVRNFILNLLPKNSTILDVGAGEGTYNNLLFKNYYRMDAVEADIQTASFLKNTSSYVNVYQENILNFQYLKRYDLIIFGDVLEHLSEDEMDKVLKEAKNWTNAILIAIPYNLPQGIVNGKILEEHKQDTLTHEIFLKKYPDLKTIWTNNEYGYYIWEQY